MDNLMKPNHKKNLKFTDRIDKNGIIPISKIKTIFEGYNHDNLNRYQKSIVWHDVGCLIFLLYVKKKYENLCNIPITVEELKEFPKKDKSLLEWIEHIDYKMYNPETHKDNKFLIYYDNQKFYFDSELINKCCNKNLSILIVSHIFPKGSGHLGCIFIQNNKAYYYDSNGLKDCDEAEYYNKFEIQLTSEMSKFGITYMPYRWKKGIQSIQNNEESKYGLDIVGMCCAWSYLIIELKLMNPDLTIEEIENKIKKKYKFKLTRMIVTYQQMMHKELSSLVGEIYKNS